MRKFIFLTFVLVIVLREEADMVKHAVTCYSDPQDTQNIGQSCRNTKLFFCEVSKTIKPCFQFGPNLGLNLSLF